MHRKHPRKLSNPPKAQRSAQAISTAKERSMPDIITVELDAFIAAMLGARTDGIRGEPEDTGGAGVGIITELA